MMVPWPMARFIARGAASHPNAKAGHACQRFIMFDETIARSSAPAEQQHGRRQHVLCRLSSRHAMPCHAALLLSAPAAAAVTLPGNQICCTGEGEFSGEAESLLTRPARPACRPAACLLPAFSRPCLSFHFFLLPAASQKPALPALASCCCCCLFCHTTG